MLNAYMDHFKYVRRPLEERLNATEQLKLNEIRAAAKALRLQAEELIQGYRRRSGSEAVGEGSTLTANS